MKDVNDNDVEKFMTKPSSNFQRIKNNDTLNCFSLNTSCFPYIMRGEEL